MSVASRGARSGDAPTEPAPIPVHLITGFLGTGKSSFIQALVATKPEDEHWAILVNEFGQVGIDQALFAGREDVSVKGLPGGCLCCQLAFVLQAGLVSLIHQTRPDRLIIEPSGLGHPAGLIDVLRSEGLASALALEEVITLLDPRALDDPRTREHGTFQDQLTLAGGVVLSKRDLASDQQLAAAHEFLAGMWPRKRWVGELGRADGETHALKARMNGQEARIIDWLMAGQGASGSVDEPLAEQMNVTMPAAHRAAYANAGQALEASVGDESPASDVMPLPGAPVIEQAEGLEHASLGWRIAASEVFDLDQLTQWLDGLPREWRIKGVFHTQDGWRSYNRAKGRAELAPSSWREDSRLELIAPLDGQEQGEEQEGMVAALPLDDSHQLNAALLACRSDGAARPFNFFGE
ncbi:MULTISPECIES: GTP-binding protein [unclassified Cobetia]|uniref:CobW family GTP-binding protein n=1 Tax=unclassified Cobetia TaxID=2609414 RepID=UPI0020972AAC|nr:MULTISPECIES: CobW family GTP-binding protein [unclassified Cobetia]MCO7231133.1 CobW family GTP-binding protein [Cobetia sp. Dlab-2-AX]MCO7234458.1 CobW family GTP-binding protein [Cobetia sp. Dlab-2-U]